MDVSICFSRYVLVFNILIASAYGGSPIPDAVVIDLPLDGTTQDVSGNGYHGSSGGVFVPDRRGNPNGALQTFANSNLSMPVTQLDWDSTASLSYSLWFMYPNFDSRYNELVKLQKDCGHFHLGVAYDKIISQMTTSVGATCEITNVVEAGPIEVGINPALKYMSHLN